MTYIDQPRVNRAKAEVVAFVRVVYFFVVINHPAELDGGKVGRQANSSAIVRRVVF
jgi:hypothetical protein